MLRIEFNGAPGSFKQICDIEAKFFLIGKLFELDPSILVSSLNTTNARLSLLKELMKSAPLCKIRNIFIKL